MSSEIRVVDDEVDRVLEQGVARLGLDIDAHARARMRMHLELLAHWNRTYNLTAVDDPRRGVTTHLLDSLSILPWLSGPRILDIGSGAGFPGLPLAIARPEFEFVLLDSRGKKVRFMQNVLRATATCNASVVQQRVEQCDRPGEFDTLVARAFSSLVSLLQGCRHLAAPASRILAMKGEYPAAELEALEAMGVCWEVVALDVPFLNATRHLVMIEPGRQQAP